MAKRPRFECPRCSSEVQISAGEVYDCSVSSWASRNPTGHEHRAPTPKDHADEDNGFCDRVSNHQCYKPMSPLLDYVRHRGLDQSRLATVSARQWTIKIDCGDSDVIMRISGRRSSAISICPYLAFAVSLWRKTHKGAELGYNRRPIDKAF
jgi:hypothetical protein